MSCILACSFLSSSSFLVNYSSGFCLSPSSFGFFPSPSLFPVSSFLLPLYHELYQILNTIAPSWTCHTLCFCNYFLFAKLLLIFGSCDWLLRPSPPCFLLSSSLCHGRGMASPSNGNLKEENKTKKQKTKKYAGKDVVTTQ